MYDVGIVGLGSVHAKDFAELMWKYFDATTAVVWAGDADDETVETFCEQFDVRPVDDHTEMLDEVDAAMITANWQSHVDFATDFLKAGVPTLVDKPFAHTLDGVEALAESRTTGDTALFGGSAIPFHRDVEEFTAPTGPRTVHLASYRDPFFYGPHVVDTARRLTDGNWERVASTPAPGKSIGVEFADGSYATIQFDGPMADAGFGILDVGGRTESTVIRSFSPSLPNSDPADRERTYRFYLERFFENVTGSRDDGEWLLDAASLLLAAQANLKHDDDITPDDERLRSLDLTEEDTVAGYLSTAES